MPRFKTVAGGYGEPVKKVQFTAAEEAARDAEEAQAAIDAANDLIAETRDDRTKRLAASDWTQFSDAPLTAAQKAAWAVYRQLLRDVTKQAGFPASVTWPPVPV